MKRIIKVLLIILTISLICTSVYLGYRFYNTKNNLNDLINEINNTDNDINKLDKEIVDLNNEIESLKNQKELLFKEYQNWQRQNKKLEEIIK